MKAHTIAIHGRQYRIKLNEDELSLVQKAADSVNAKILQLAKTQDGDIQDFIAMSALQLSIENHKTKNSSQKELEAIEKINELFKLFDTK